MSGPDSYWQQLNAQNGLCNLMGLQNQVNLQNQMNVAAQAAGFSEQETAKFFSSDAIESRRAERERYFAARAAEDKRLKILSRGKRMSTRLERRRDQIRMRWLERSKAVAFWIVIPPVAVFVFAWLWRIALAAILS